MFKSPEVGMISKNKSLIKLILNDMIQATKMKINQKLKAKFVCVSVCVTIEIYFLYASYK